MSNLFPNKVDRFLSRLGIQRWDLCYTWRWKRTIYLIPPFNPLWWVITAILAAGAIALFCCFLIAMVILST